EVCKVYDEEKGTKDGENKLGDTDIEIDDGDKEDTVVGNSLDGNQAMKMRVVMSEEKRGVSLSSLVGSRGDRSRKKRKSYDEEVFGGDGVEKAFNKGKMIDVSWKLAEDVMSRKTVDRVDSKEEVAAEEALI
ncbi:hypothetical protein Tco_1383985, partial [Tanacetum coccineum]